MKKLYLYTSFITCISLATACMEQEIPLETFNQNLPRLITFSMCGSPVETFIPSHKPAYKTVQSQETRTQQSYSANVPQNMQKPCLRTITTQQPDRQAIMKKLKMMNGLYSQTYGLVDGNILIANNVIALVKNMQNAYDNGINEDCMARFAYSKINSWNNLSQCIPLKFSCLKKYKLLAAKRNEVLPPENKTHNQKKIVKLAQILGVQSPTQSSIEMSEEYNYLAFTDLMVNLKDLYRLLSCHTRSLIKLTDYIYSNKKRMQEELSQGTYINLIDDFYTKTSLLLNSESFTYLEVYDLLCIIDNAKKSQEISSEKEFGRALLNHESITAIPLTDLKIDWVPDKNRVSLFCLLLEKYNTVKDHKTTPTPLQYSCHQTYMEIRLPLPDSFDETLFHCQHYAFDEFNRLIRDIEALQDSDKKEIQYCIEQKYSLKKNNNAK